MCVHLSPPYCLYPTRASIKFPVRSMSPVTHKKKMSLDAEKLGLKFARDILMRPGTAADPVKVAIDAIHIDAYCRVVKNWLEQLHDGKLHVVFQKMSDDGIIEYTKTFSNASLHEMNKRIEDLSEFRKIIVNSSE